MRQGLGILSLIFALMFGGVSMTYGYPDSADKIKVEEGKAFEISLSEVINPFAVWKCAKYDPQYIELLGGEYKAPPEGLVGATTHIFKFKALRAGKTDIVFETEDKKESKLYEIHIQKRPLLSRLCGMYNEPELVTKSEPLDFTTDIHTITDTIEADSWEDLRETFIQQEYFLENNGDSTIEITRACMKHRPISITPSPYTGNSEPYTITWAVTNSTVEPGGTTSLWMDMKFNCSGKIEITDVEVYYLYKGERHTATMDMNRWIIDVVMKNEPSLEISVEENT